MFNQNHCIELINSESYQEVDDYLVEFNKQSPYDKECLIILVMWLDFDKFTWNEYAIERIEIYRKKFPLDVEVFILYFLYSNWIWLVSSNTSIEELQLFINTNKNHKYYSILLYLHIYWIEDKYRYGAWKEFYLNQTDYKLLLDEINSISTESVALHLRYAKYYHIHEDFKKVEIEIKRMKSFIRESIYWNIPIIDYQIFMEAMVLLLYWWKKDTSNLEEVIRRHETFSEELYLF